MRKFVFITIMVALMLGNLFVGISQTQAVTINFDDGTTNTSIDNHYSSLGVTFLNAQWVNVLLPPFDGVDDHFGASLPLVIQAVSTADGNPRRIDETNAIIGIFSIPVTSISITALDVGGSHARIKAYDTLVGGTPIAEDTVFGINLSAPGLPPVFGPGDNNFQTLTVSAPYIKRFELYQPDVHPIFRGDGVWFDNLEYNPIPEPSTIFLLGSSLFVAAIVLRKKIKKQIQL